MQYFFFILQDALKMIQTAIDEGSVFLSVDPPQCESVYREALEKTEDVLGPANPNRIEVLLLESLHLGSCNTD